MAFESIASTTYASRTNTVVNAPAGIAVGDLLIITHFFGGNPATTITPPAGFSSIPGLATLTVGPIGGFTGNFRAWYKLAASGDTSATTYTLTHTAGPSQAVMARYSGIDSVDPFEPAPTSNSGSTADSTATGFTTTVDNTVVVLFGFDWGDTTTNLTPPTGTTPTFTERLDTTLMYAADGVLSPAGATGNKTFANNANTGAGWGTVLIGLRPAGGSALTKQIDDTATITDGIATSGAAAHTRQIDDTATIADTTSKAPGKTLADALEVTDSGTAFDTAILIADAVTVTDQPSTAWAASRTVADSATITDAINTGGSTARTLNVDDAIAAGDALAKDYGRPLADEMTAADALARDFGHPIDDTATATDQASTAWGAVRTIDDAATVTDAVAPNGAAAHVKAIDDTVTAADQPSTAWAAVRAIDDTGQLADQAGTAWSAVLTVDDSATLSDFVSTGAAAAHSKQIDDTANIGDVLDRAWGATLALGDALTAADALGRSWAASRTFAESLTIAEHIDGIPDGTGFTYSLDDTSPFTYTLDGSTP